MIGRNKKFIQLISTHTMRMDSFEYFRKYDKDDV